MSDDLVERVARAMADERWGDPELWGLLKDEAKAAIAIALEEAAKVVLSCDYMGANTNYMKTKIATAIRAMIKEKNDE